MMLSVLSAFLSSLLVGGDGRKEDAVQNELGRLQGTWKGVFEERAGKREKPQIDTLTIEGNTMVLASSIPDGDRTAKWVRKWTFTIDSAKTPGEIDIEVPLRIIRRYRHTQEHSLLFQKGVERGIYELHDDTLRICLEYSGDRPTRFDTRDTNTRNNPVLYVFKRQRTEKEVQKTK